MAGEAGANRDGDDESGGTDGDGDGREDGGDHRERKPLTSLSLEEALSVVGEETRAQIVVALGEARVDDGLKPAVLSFSELMDRVGAEDSGRFNYHLDKLVGTFVSRTDEGYQIRQPGHLVYQAIVAGTFTDRDPVEPFVADDCPECDSEVTATYRSDHILLVSCPDCEENGGGMYVPPRMLVGRSNEEMLDAARQRTRHDIELLRRGVCYGCGGRVRRDLGANVSDFWEEWFDYDVFATMVCESCNESIVGHPVDVAGLTPPVVGFFHDHGRDAARLSTWEDVVFDAHEATSVESESPLRVAVPLELDGERLRVVLDDDLRVVESERSPL